MPHEAVYCLGSGGAGRRSGEDNKDTAPVEEESRILQQQQQQTRRQGRQFRAFTTASDDTLITVKKIRGTQVAPHPKPYGQKYPVVDPDHDHRPVAEARETTRQVPLTPTAVVPITVADDIDTSRSKGDGSRIEEATIPSPAKNASALCDAIVAAADAAADCSPRRRLPTPSSLVAPTAFQHQTQLPAKQRGLHASRIVPTDVHAVHEGLLVSRCRSAHDPNTIRLPCGGTGVENSGVMLSARGDRRRIHPTNTTPHQIFHVTSNQRTSSVPDDDGVNGDYTDRTNGTMVPSTDIGGDRDKRSIRG